MTVYHLRFVAQQPYDQTYFGHPFFQLCPDKTRASEAGHWQQTSPSYPQPTFRLRPVADIRLIQLHRLLLAGSGKSAECSTTREADLRPLRIFKLSSGMAKPGSIDRDQEFALSDRHHSPRDAVAAARWARTIAPRGPTEDPRPARRIINASRPASTSGK